MQERPSGDQKAVSVACGGWHTAVIGEKGGVWTCGRGEYGRLGLGDEKSQVGTVVGAVLRMCNGALAMVSCVRGLLAGLYGTWYTFGSVTDFGWWYRILAVSQTFDHITEFW